MIRTASSKKAPPDTRTPYEKEADRRASKIILASMNRKLHTRPMPTQTEEYDPHEWL